MQRRTLIHRPALVIALFSFLTYGLQGTINWNDVKQRIDGFGASDAWFSDEIMEHPKHGEMLDLLFKKDGGAGLSILRHRVSPKGADDQRADHTMTKEAFARDCEIVWAAAWTPPKAWKTNDHPNGGSLKKEHYQDFAEYLEQYRSNHDEATDIPLFGISPQNEPGKKPWESCVWDKNDFRDFVRDHFGPTLKSSCRIIAPEETRWDNVDDFYTPIHNDATAREYVDIVAGHCYPSSNKEISYNHFGKPVWMTEWSYDTGGENLSIGNGVEWALNFWTLLIKAEVSACHHWWLVNCHDDGKQQGLIAAPAGSRDYSVSKRLWTIGNFSKFVRPGWHRIDATGDLEWQNYCAAFKNTETGDFAIMLINNNNESHSVTIDFNGFTCASVTPHRTSATEDLKQLPAIDAGSSLTVEVPSKTVTTYVGRGDGATGVPRESGIGRPEIGVPELTRGADGAIQCVLSPGFTGTVSLDVRNPAGQRVGGFTVADGRSSRRRTVISGTGKNSLFRPAPGLYVCRVTLRTAAGRTVYDRRLVVPH